MNNLRSRHFITRRISSGTVPTTLSIKRNGKKKLATNLIKFYYPFGHEPSKKILLHYFLLWKDIISRKLLVIPNKQRNNIWRKNSWIESTLIYSRQSLCSRRRRCWSTFFSLFSIFIKLINELMNFKGKKINCIRNGWLVGSIS